MRVDSWVTGALGDGRIAAAREEAARRRIAAALDLRLPRQVPAEELEVIALGLLLAVLDELDGDNSERLRAASAEAFKVVRVLPRAGAPMLLAEELVRLGCLGVLADRGADVRSLLLSCELPELPLDSADWGVRVWSTVLHIWLLLFRKRGWDDLDDVAKAVVLLREAQREFEPQYLDPARATDAAPAWQLVTAYHLAKAAELLGTFLGQGQVGGRYDITQQLDAQFDRALAAAARCGQVEREVIARLLHRSAGALVANSIWTVTRGVNSRVTRFVRSLTAHQSTRPIFEMLPPQRRVLHEAGLLGSSLRSVVVCLPTSSGKTMIAAFRILQALNQFDEERGWVAYLAPTRALVNQITLRLRRDFGGLAVVEKVSPALEVDGLEAGMLSDADQGRQFRVLVTTPEKLNMMLRGGWEQKIDRPLTLVVVDEAHNLGDGERGLKLELLLATINRECQNAQFLLLTPFVPNAEQIAKWLDPVSSQHVDLAVSWSPNDRVVALAEPVGAAGGPGAFAVGLRALHTTQPTLSVPEQLSLPGARPLGYTRSQVVSSPNKLAAATASLLARRGTVVVLVTRKTDSWGVARDLGREFGDGAATGEDLEHVQRFVRDEMGPDHPLAERLGQGVGVHHAGLSEDCRTLVEWLTEKGDLRALVATTTLAQGVNFPISGVVFAGHKYPYGKEMPPEDFWNIVGRAGRIGQADVGVVALAATNEDKAAALRAYVERNVGALNSTLVEMVESVAVAGTTMDLAALAWQPGWSSFVQYLAHTYRQIGNHDAFAAEVELVLRGTLGFESLRQSQTALASRLVASVRAYAEGLRGKSLQFVDATGFSWESVAATLGRLSENRVTHEAWTPELFATPRPQLQRMMGVLLQVPELREQLAEVTGGGHGDGDKLARIICDWVNGKSLAEMAATHYPERDGVASLTTCCQKVFGRLVQTASWGLSALQALTWPTGQSFDDLPADEQRKLRNLPARVYYGVNSEEALALRLLGVPRMAAAHMARTLAVSPSEPLHEVRGKLRDASPEAWRDAMGDRGPSYHRVWSIIEGTAQ